MNFVLQPVYSNRGVLFGVECLTRNGSQAGWAESFFRNAECKVLNDFLSAQLDMIEQCYSWFEKNRIRISINLRSDSLDFISLPHIKSKLTRMQLLCLEVDEKDTNILSQINFPLLNSISNPLWLDDFGSGVRWPSSKIDQYVSVVKVDKFFFWDAIESEDTFIRLLNLVRDFYSRNIKVIIEGIENQSHLDALKRFDNVMAQGFCWKEIAVDELLTLPLTVDL